MGSARPWPAVFGLPRGALGATHFRCGERGRLRWIILGVLEFYSVNQQLIFLEGACLSLEPGETAQVSLPGAKSEVRTSSEGTKRLITLRSALSCLETVPTWGHEQWSRESRWQQGSGSGVGDLALASSYIRAANDEVSFICQGHCYVASRETLCRHQGAYCPALSLPSLARRLHTVLLSSCLIVAARLTHCKAATDTFGCTSHAGRGFT